MSVETHIEAFARGWNQGDLEVIMSSLAPVFSLDDPNVGQVPRKSIPEYLANLKSVVASLRDDGAVEQPLMEMSDVVIKSDELPVSVWTWWTVPGTPIGGSALVKVGEDGVISERLSYYTKLAG